MKVTLYHGLLVVALTACSRNFIEAPPGRARSAGAGVTSSSRDGRNSRAGATRAASTAEGLDWNSGYGGAVITRSRGISSADDGLGAPPVAPSTVAMLFGCVDAGPARLHSDSRTRELDIERFRLTGPPTACGQTRLRGQAAWWPWGLAGSPPETDTNATSFTLGLWSFALALDFSVPVLFPMTHHATRGIPR
jgi:hypothetical protein